MSKRKKTREFSTAKDQSSKANEQTSKASLKNIGVSRPGRATETTAKPSDLWDLATEQARSESAIDSGSVTETAFAAAAEIAPVIEPAPEANAHESDQPPQVAKSGSMIDWSEPAAESEQVAEKTAPQSKSKKKNKRQSVLQQISGQALPAPHAVERPNVEFEAPTRLSKTEMLEIPSFAALHSAQLEASAQEQSRADAEVAADPAEPDSEVWIPVVGWKPPPRKNTTENATPMEQQAAPSISTCEHQPAAQAVEANVPVQPEHCSPPAHQLEPVPQVFQSEQSPAFPSEPIPPSFQSEPAPEVFQSEQPVFQPEPVPPSDQSEPAPQALQAEQTSAFQSESDASSYWAEPPAQTLQPEPKPATQSKPIAESYWSGPTTESAAPVFPSQPVFQSEPTAPQSEPHTLKAEPQAFPSEPQVLQSEPQAFPSEPQVFQTEPRAFPSEPQVLQSEPQAFPSEPQVLQSEPPQPEFQSEPISSASFQSASQESRPAAEFSNEHVSPERPAQRRTIVQEFDISKLVKATERKTQEVMKLEPSPEFDSAMHYFTASAERMTYTAELRFRANYTPSEKKEAASAPPPEASWNQVTDETSSGSNNTMGFKFLNDFVPPRQDLPVAASTGFNMLDLIDEGYRTVQPNPTFSQTRGPGKVEVAVDWVNSNGRLPPPSRDGLAGGLGGSSKAPSGQYKKNWLKK